MTYLAHKSYVHRDVAARNVLVSDDDVCKVPFLSKFTNTFKVAVHGLEAITLLSFNRLQILVCQGIFRTMKSIFPVVARFQ